MSAAVRVLTWNVQGAQGLDVVRVARVIGSTAPDVIALQEVQRRQVNQLATALAVNGKRWALKHWPVIHRAEGLAVLTPHRLVTATSFTLRPRPIWDWRRRIGIDATIDTGTVVVRVVDVHLSAHDDGGARAREARLLVDRAADRMPAPIITGDLNDVPRDGAHAELVGAGWVDAWHRVHGDAPDGATNWTSGDRRGRGPTQRIDYVLAPSGAVIEHAAVVADVLGVDVMAGLSDHLPLLATVRLPEVGRVDR